MTDSTAPRVSVVKPIGLSLRRMREVLFGPFDFKKWLCLGFCSAVAGSTASLNYRLFKTSPEIKDLLSWNALQLYVHQHIFWILFGLLGGLLIFLAIIWVNCRGSFMFLHGVVLNCAEIKTPWKKYKKLAGSLWVLNTLVGLLSLLNICTAIGIVFWSIIRNPLAENQFDTLDILHLIPLVGTLLVSAFFFGIIRLFTDAFVVPIMSLRGGTWRSAWEELAGLITNHPWRFILFLLFQVVLGLGIVLVILTVIVCTFLLGLILMLIPYIGSVFLLPISVFLRSYSLYYLAQFGESYDVFSVTVPSSLHPPKLQNHVGESLMGSVQ